MSANNPTPFNRAWPLLLLFLGSPLWAFEPDPVQDAYLLGMGGAGAAVAGGTHSVFLNPAGTARSTMPLLQSGLGFTHSGDLRFNLSLVYPFRDGTVFSLSQGSDIPAAPGSSTLVAGSIGLPLDSSHDFLLGLNLKYISLSSDPGSALQGGRGFGLDLGVAYDLRRPQGTLASFGLSFLDLASQVRFQNNLERALARRVVMGAAYLGIPETRLEMDLTLVDRSSTATVLEDRLRFGAERFFADRFYSLRIGVDGVLNQDVRLAIGGGFHPDRPFEVCYAFQTGLNQASFLHSLTFVWRFDEPGPGQGPEGPKFSGPSPEIDIALAKTGSPTGRPVSPLLLSKITVKADPPFFSPSGIQKRTILSFPGGVPPGVEKWRLDVLSSGDATLRVLEGTGNLPISLVWDGKDQGGKAVENGRYRLALKTFDLAGKPLSDDQGVVEVLSARPKFSLRSNDPYLSSGGGRGTRSELRFTVDPDGPWDVSDWDFEVTESVSGKKVHQQTGKTSLPRTLRWNGKSGPENAVEGTYFARLTAVDKAGNRLRSDALKLFVDNSPPRLTLRPNNSLVDLEGGEILRMLVSSEDLSGLQNWRVDFEGVAGGTLGRVEGRGNLPGELTWDGKTPAGTLVQPGSLLKAVLRAQDRAGNKAEAPTVHFQVDFKPKAAGGQMTLSLATVRFPEKGYDLDEGSRQQLAASASSIQQYIQKSVLVVKGYAAEAESEDPVLLSYQRASQVVDYLVKNLGVPATSVHAVGYSVQKVPAGGTPSSLEGQRRAVVTLTTLP